MPCAGRGPGRGPCAVTTPFLFSPSPGPSGTVRFSAEPSAWLCPPEETSSPFGLTSASSVSLVPKESARPRAPVSGRCPQGRARTRRPHARVASLGKPCAVISTYRSASRRLRGQRGWDPSGYLISKGWGATHVVCGPLISVSGEMRAAAVRRREERGDSLSSTCFRLESWWVIKVLLGGKDRIRAGGGGGSPPVSDVTSKIQANFKKSNLLLNSVPFREADRGGVSFLSGRAGRRG